MRPNVPVLLNVDPGGDRYRFEVGGGHWIFGGDNATLAFLSSLARLREYERRSAVCIRSRGQYFDYPLQTHYRSLSPELAAAIDSELAHVEPPLGRTLDEWLQNRFGRTLCDLFFFPFHERYTASLYKLIAPQDGYKSPNSAPTRDTNTGYNPTFIYPERGLDSLIRSMADRCEIRYGAKVTAIDLARRQAVLEGGDIIPFDTLLSTLPLNVMLTLCGLHTTTRPDPFTSVLVINIGAVKGGECPPYHWIYVPDAKAPFYRVGFYSNVDKAFAPTRPADGRSRVGIYVERAFQGGTRPTEAEARAYEKQIVEELQDWRFIADVEAVHATWIDVAYTWTWPSSTWRAEAISTLERHGITMVGRYGRWHFQGIAESIRDGLLAGTRAST